MNDILGNINDTCEKLWNAFVDCVEWFMNLGYDFTSWAINNWVGIVVFIIVASIAIFFFLIFIVDEGKPNFDK